MSDNQELDVILLRSFLAVSETLHFTSAAQMRGVTQSTISQHINRLEQAVGASLLHRTTKQVELTPQGMQMVSFAQNIIHAQGMAMDYFRSGTLRVELRLGIAEDMVVSRFPEMLKRFRRLYPHVEVRLTVGLSRELYNLLDAGALDLICTKRKEGDERGIPLWRERLQWLGGGNFDTLVEGAVPLVLFSGNSITRVAAIAAMNKVGRAWRASFMSSTSGRSWQPSGPVTACSPNRVCWSVRKSCPFPPVRIFLLCLMLILLWLARRSSLKALAATWPT